TPLLHQRGLGRYVGHSSGNGRGRGLKEPGQAQEGNVQIKWLTRHLRPVFHHECLHPRARAQETHQGRLAGQDNVLTARCDVGQITHKLDRVPQSLLSIDEEGLLRKRCAIPAWLCKRWRRTVWTPPAPFILTPALLKIPTEEPRDGAIPVRLHKVWFV